MPPSSLGVLGDPAHGGEAVVGRGGEAGLGGVAVVDRDDDGVGPHAQVAAERVVGVVAAEHPAAAVEVRHDRVRAGRGRPVQAVLELGAVGAGERAVDDLADLGARAGARRSMASENARASSADIESIVRQLELGHHLEHHRHVGLQRGG